MPHHNQKSHATSTFSQIDSIPTRKEKKLFYQHCSHHWITLKMMAKLYVAQLQNLLMIWNLGRIDDPCNQQWHIKIDFSLHQHFTLKWSPNGSIVKLFVSTLAAEWKGVREWKWSSEQFFSLFLLFFEKTWKLPSTWHSLKNRVRAKMLDQR